MTFDWVLKNFCLVVLFFSSRSNHRARGSLLSVQSWRAVRKECLTWLPGAVVSEIDNRCRLLWSIVGVLVRSIASWGWGKIGQYDVSKIQRRGKAILNARIQILQLHERVTEPNWGRRPIGELLCACMHARALCAAAAAVHAFSVNSVELGTSNDSFQLL